MKILTYVLYGTWHTQSTDGVEVLGVSGNIEPLLKRLDEIADSKAKDYVEMRGYIQEKRDERCYEAVNVSGKYAKFYIAEHYLEITEPLMGAVSREKEKADRGRDIEEYLKNLYKRGGIEPWEYEYIEGNDSAAKEILQMFEKAEDCNTSFNATMDIVVKNAIKTIQLDDKKLEYLWEKFGDVLVDDDECILDDFLGFECGTHREEVWHWFDERYSGGVYGLMFGCAGEEEVELGEKHIERIDEIHHAVYEMCKVLAEKEDLEWDMYYIGEITDFAANILVSMGNKVRYPAIASGDNGRQYIVEYHGGEVLEDGEVHRD